MHRGGFGGDVRPRHGRFWGDVCAFSEWQVADSVVSVGHPSVSRDVEGAVRPLVCSKEPFWTIPLELLTIS